MQGKRQLLADTLYSSGLVAAFQRRSATRLLVLNYHRIYADGASRVTDFDDRLSGVSASQFERQIAWIERNMHPLDEEALLCCLRSGGHGTRTCVAVTFDDGYLDNYSLAYPVLRKYKVPAFFFICSKLVTDRTMGWWDLISYFLKKTRKSSIDVDGRRFLLPSERTVAERHYKERIKLEPSARTCSLVQELSNACEVDLPPTEEQDRYLMNWDQLREVSRNGIVIGSHTHTHPVLATLEPPGQKKELLLSKTIIEQQLQLPVRSLAYPVGGTQHFTRATQTIAQDCGYDIAFSYSGGINHWRDLDRYAIKRISIDGDGSQIAATVAFPGLFA